MKETLFVSDVHLDACRPGIIELFNTFLMERAARADALYILGDLFESWIGDDAPYQAYETTFSCLLELTRHHQVPVFFMHGNRDFLIAQRFATMTGVQLLPEEKMVVINQQKVLLMHGDTLCTDDIEYQRFRKKTHNKLLQWMVLHLPVKTRQKLASHLRDTSKQAINEKPAEIMDVNQDAVITAMQKHDVDTLIHGHTHRPAIHDFTIGNTRCQRAVLGDWYQGGNFLSLHQAGLQLAFFADLNELRATHLTQPH